MCFNCAYFCDRTILLEIPLVSCPTVGFSGLMVASSSSLGLRARFLLLPRSSCLCIAASKPREGKIECLASSGSNWPENHFWQVPSAKIAVRTPQCYHCNRGFCAPGNATPKCRKTKSSTPLNSELLLSRCSTRRLPFAWPPVMHVDHPRDCSTCCPFQTSSDPH